MSLVSIDARDEIERLKRDFDAWGIILEGVGVCAPDLSGAVTGLSYYLDAMKQRLERIDKLLN